MNVYVISSSPNINGLTAACADAAIEGIKAAGSNAVQISLNTLNVNQCHACSNGWGTCQSEHRCQTEDDFQSLHKDLTSAEALVLVTPVYWGEMSESAKAFTDRLRRCEATRSRGESGRNARPQVRRSMRINAATAPGMAGANRGTNPAEAGTREHQWASRSVPRAASNATAKV